MSNENKGSEKPVFTTVKSQEIEFGKGRFIEVARKIAKTSTSTNEFISITRGRKNGDSKRFDTTLSLPIDQKIVDFVAEQLKKMM